MKALFKSDYEPNNTSGIGSSKGIAKRLYNWIDDQEKVSYSLTKKRSIDDIKIRASAAQNVGPTFFCDGGTNFDFLNIIDRFHEAH